MSNHTKGGGDPADRYWREHFKCDPTPLERHMFRIARRYLSPSDPFMFLFALMIHVSSLVHLDADRSFMADAAVSRDLAKQMRTDYDALSKVIPLFERRMEQLEFLAKRTENQIRGWENHEERLSFWQIKPQELPKWSLIVVVGMIATFSIAAVMILTP